MSELVEYGYFITKMFYPSADIFKMELCRSLGGSLYNSRKEKKIEKNRKDRGKRDGL